MPTTDELITSYLSEIELCKLRIADAEAEMPDAMLTRRETLEQTIKDNKDAIKNIQADLKFYGYKAKAPAKAAEKSTVRKEKR